MAHSTRQARSSWLRLDLRILLVIFLTSVVSLAAITKRLGNLMADAEADDNAQEYAERFFSNYKTPKFHVDYMNADFVEDDFPYNTTGKVTILMWDGGTPFGWGYGEHIPLPNYGGFPYNKGHCPVECEWTTDRARLPTADSVLFDPCLTGPDGYRDVPVYMPQKLPKQRWGWFTYEQLHYFPMMSIPEYMNRFDHKMTYHHDAQVQITFACPWGGVDIDAIMKPPAKKSVNKVVAFFASNCDTGGAKVRTAYVKELMDYIKVDSFGHCLHNTDFKWENRGDQGVRMREKNNVISGYKFLLAFENNNEVDDYVTEKLINAYQAGVVPIYSGAPNIAKWEIAEHSMINIRDYKSPKELAEYLNFLNENDEAYYSYFAWKKTGVSRSFEKLWSKCYAYGECRVCKYIAKERAKNGPIAKPSTIKDYGIVGYALQLNSLDADLHNDDDYVSIPINAALDLRYDWSIAAWIKLGLITDGRIFDKNTAGGFDGYLLDVILSSTRAGQGHFRVCAANNCFHSERTLAVGLWYHVAATFSKQNGNYVLRMYINGKLDSTHSPGTETSVNSLQARMGRAASGGHSWRPHHAATVFDGAIDEVSVWGKALEETEIYKWMFERPVDDTPNLIAWWPFDEGSGSTVKPIGPHKEQLIGNINGHPSWIVSVSKPVLDPSNAEGKKPL